MSSSATKTATEATAMNEALAKAYYGVALPAMQTRLGSINQALGLPEGLPDYMREAYATQRTGLAEGITGKGQDALTSQLAGTKGARAGGNVFAGGETSTAAIGAALANALYGSKFQESQAGIEQTMNLMSMALGGAGTAGSGALTASAQELGAVRYLPNYNTTYANVAGGLAGVASLYGAGQQAGWWGGVTPPTTTIAPGSLGTPGNLP